MEKIKIKVKIWEYVNQSRKWTVTEFVNPCIFVPWNPAKPQAKRHILQTE